jgi:very-short-patch-repair endonuclease
MLHYRSDLKQKARNNRKNMNKPEAKLWYEVLNKKRLGYKFLRQKPIQKYIVDFYCHQLKLVIEVDGFSHDDQKEYDIDREKCIANLGIKILHYSNWQIMNNIDGVCEDIIENIEQIKQEKNPSAQQS